MAVSSEPPRRRRHAGAMIPATIAEAEVARSPGRRAENRHWVSGNEELD
jgi:hypothetical protein